MSHYDELCDLVEAVVAEGVDRVDAARAAASALGLPWRERSDYIDVCLDPSPRPGRFRWGGRSFESRGSVYVSFRNGPMNERPWPHVYMWK